MYAEVDFVIASISVAIIIVVLYGPWQSLWTDWARQDMFEIRDRIFDMAANGRMSFEDESYTIIRESIQSSIRFAHDLSWTTFVSWLVLQSDETEGKPSNLYATINAIEDASIREELNGYRRRLAVCSLGLMVVRSPVFLILSPIFLFIGYITISNKRRYLGELADRMQKEAETVPA